MIRQKDWDSDFFKLKIGEINFEDYQEENTILDYDLIYIISEKEFHLKLNGFDNSFSEQKVKFHKELSNLSKLSKKVFSHSAFKYNIQDLYQLAYESGKKSRFLLDKKFGEYKFKELYRLWIDNSISYSFATDVLIFFDNNEAQGLLTYSISENNALVGLFAVSASQQGKGIGGILLNHLEAVLVKKGIKKLIIPTQLENKQACNFYNKQGYSIFEITHIKHYWKNK